MKNMTIEIDSKIENKLNNIAQIENKQIYEILRDAIEDYLERYNETNELLSNKETYKQIFKGKKEVKEGTKGLLLDELKD